MATYGEQLAKINEHTERLVEAINQGQLDVVVEPILVKPELIARGIKTGKGELSLLGKDWGPRGYSHQRFG